MNERSEGHKSGANFVLNRFAAALPDSLFAKEVVLFGASYVAQYFAQLLDKVGIRVTGVVDNNLELVGKEWCGMEVLRPVAQNLAGRYILIMSAVASEIIGEQLDRMGFRKGKDYTGIIDIENALTKEYLEAVEAQWEQSYLLSNAFFYGLKRVAHRNVSLFNRVFAAVSEHKGKIIDSSVLELGYGNTLVPAIMFALAGASFVRAVDKGHDPDVFDAHQYRELAGYLFEHPPVFLNRESGVGERLFKRLAQCIRINGMYVHFNDELFQIDGEKDIVGLHGEGRQYQVIYSHNVLEHVEFPGDVIRTLFKLASPGCITWHSIDLSDHESRNGVPQFYTGGKKEYGKQCGINFLRASDWEQLFEAEGWEIVSNSSGLRCPIKGVKTINVHPDFSAYDDADLTCMEMIITARRN